MSYHFNFVHVTSSLPFTSAVVTSDSWEGFGYCWMAVEFFPGVHPMGPYLPLGQISCIFCHCSFFGTFIRASLCSSLWHLSPDYHIIFLIIPPLPPLFFHFHNHSGGWTWRVTLPYRPVTSMENVISNSLFCSQRHLLRDAPPNSILINHLWWCQ